MWQALLLACLTGTLSPQQSRQLVERYNQVQSAVETQDYARATDLLRGLCRDFGNSEFGDELNYALAEAYFNQGRYDRALGIFRSIIDRPHYTYIKPEAMYGTAITYTMMGNYQQARTTLERLSRERGYDQDPRTNFAFGVLHYFQREYEQAVAKLEGLEMPEAKFYLARCYASTGRPLPALLKFKGITDGVPNTPLATMAHFAAGQALFLNRDYDGARAKFQFFIDNFPYSPLADYAHYFLGCALIALGENAGAIEHLMPLTRHSNNYLAAHANYFIGYANMALGQSQQAVERFQRVRANYPKTKVASFANLELSQAMLQTADTGQTLLATSQLARMFSTGELSGVGNYLSGVIYYQVGEYERAGDKFEELLINYGSTSLREPAAAMLLLSLNSSGQFEKAVAVGAKYVADFPDDPSPWRARTLYFLA
ncbi:tetratricopeptide repeat protein, partial [candidate division WOR-3 bacterium]|nr:tetratricopeptide repeat protein [candidate division WOR-3 bacterium]